MSLAFGVRPASAPRVCGVCGAKSRADRPRCLRCGASFAAVFVEPQPARVPAKSRAIVGALAVAVVVVCGAWYALRSSGESKVAVAPARSASRQVPATGVRPDDVRPTPADGPPERGREALLRGNAAYRTGDMGVALASFQRAVDANPNDPEALNNLAQVLERGGRAPQAIPLFRRAAELQPDRWSYRFNLAHALGQTGDWIGAVAEYRQADRRFPDDHVTLFNLGLALRKINDQQGAIEVLGRAATLAPEEPDFLLALGQSYISAGRMDDGRRTLEQYLTVAPDGADAALVRATLDRLQGEQ